MKMFPKAHNTKGVDNSCTFNTFALMQNNISKYSIVIIIGALVLPMFTIITFLAQLVK